MCEDYGHIPEDEPMAAVNTARTLHKALSSTAAQRPNNLSLLTAYSTMANTFTTRFNIK
jgi:hypothetical protein